MTNKIAAVRARILRSNSFFGANGSLIREKKSVDTFGMFILVSLQYEHSIKQGGTQSRPLVNSQTYADPKKEPRELQKH
jgi:hypothetical protein